MTIYNLLTKEEIQMTIQEQLMNQITKISEQDQEMLLIIVNRLIEKEEYKNGASPLQRLSQNIKQIKQYLPQNFDPAQEYEEAMVTKYEGIN